MQQQAVLSRLRTLRASLRAADTRWQRRRFPHRRHVLVDAETRMEYAVLAPILRALGHDERVAVWAMSSTRPSGAGRIFHELNDQTRLIHPRAASLRKFDIYLTADLLWTPLPRGARRVNVSHGVAGKYSDTYDRPARRMREWDRIFFINRRRLNNYVASDAIEPAAARLIGMPKVDCLRDGTLTRNGVLASLDLDPNNPTVLYAPTWSQHSSLVCSGEQIVRGLADAGYQVIVKLHANSWDPLLSGNVDWGARLTAAMRGRGVVARDSDACPYMMAADALVTDHSSVGFEYLLLDRPLVRIDMPELVRNTRIAPEYVELLATTAWNVATPGEAIQAVGDALADPGRFSERRRAIAAELFFEPGSATLRAVSELYEMLELETPAAGVH